MAVSRLLEGPSALASVLAKRSKRDFSLGDALSVEDLRRDPALVVELIRAYQAGRRGAAELLLEVYGPFIGSCLKRYVYFYGRDLEDFQQEAALAVLDACARWDFGRGTASPTSYVFKYVRGFMHRYAVLAESCVRVPVHAYDRKRQASARMREFSRTLSLAPVCRLLSEYEGTPSRELPPLKGRGIAAASDEVGGEALEDLFFDEDAEGAEVVLAALDEGRSLPRVSEVLLALCDDREIDVVARRFADDAWTLEEVGRSYGFTRERARQIEFKALGLCLDRARRILARARWDGYDGWLSMLVERVRAADRESEASQEARANDAADRPKGGNVVNGGTRCPVHVRPRTGSTGPWRPRDLDVESH